MNEPGNNVWPIVVDTKETLARVALMEAQTEHYQTQSALANMELEHKTATDKLRIYHFPAAIYAETIDTCIEVLQHWINIDPTTPMTVAFNSPGGIVFEGFALYDFIVDHVEQGVPINTTSYGKCASMAAVVLQSGQIRSMHRNAHFMVHEVNSFIQGTMQSLKEQLEFAEKLQDRIEKILVGRANPEMISQGSLHERTQHRDWWFTAEEALQYGFIDQIANS